MQKEKKNKTFIFGIIVVIIGVIVGIIPIFTKEEEKREENTKIDEFMMNTSSKEEEKKEEENKIDMEEEDSEEYLMVLEIPKIGFQKGIYSKDSSLNTIDHHVAIMKESDFPNKKFGNVILAGHNGNSSVSYFNQLHKLEIKDKAILYYQGRKYVYVVDQIYDVKKDGNVEVIRDLDKNTLTLITCKRNTSDRQLVVIFYLDTILEY